LATPYTEEPNVRLKEYYKSQGVDVLKCVGLGISVNNDIADVPLERIRALIREANHGDAEAIVVPCTNFPAALVVEEMETELSKYIFDSVIVTLKKGLWLLDFEMPVHGWGMLMRDCDVLRKLNGTMDKLRQRTNSSRTTVRLDMPAYNCHVDRVCAESLEAGILSLRPNTSLNQRALKTCIFINETGKALVQNDTKNAATPPPKALMDIYGVRAQMLVPLMYEDGDGAGGWISVHFVPGTRSWDVGNIGALFQAAKDACRVLIEGGWMAEQLVVREEWVVE